MVDEAANFMQKGRVAFEREPDLEIAETALASNLKLLESLLQADPENSKLRLFLAEGYALYSMAFVEDRYEEYKFSDVELSEHNRRRAILFYIRSRDYAGSGIIKEMKLESINQITRENLEKYLAIQNQGDVPKLFWFAFSWISSVNLQRDDIGELISIPYVEMIMERVRQLDDRYYFGGVYLFEGMLYGGRPQMLGGNAERSIKAFQKAENISGKSILLIPYYKAWTYCIQEQNMQCFRENLNFVIEAKDDINPDQMLANALAKKKARRLMLRSSEYFLEDNN